MCTGNNSSKFLLERPMAVRGAVSITQDGLRASRSTSSKICRVNDVVFLVFKVMSKAIKLFSLV